jgi:hypothetical protein
VWPEFKLEQMTEEEKAERVLTEFKTSLFDDLIIKAADIFKDTVYEDVWSFSPHHPSLAKPDGC